MKRFDWILGTLTACIFAVAATTPASAQEKKDEKPKAEAKKPEAKPAAPAAKADDKKPAGGAAAPSPEEMKAMQNMELMGKVTENHKLLADNLAGEWTYECKMWQGPEPQISTGKCSSKMLYGGRYLHASQTGSMEMPGPDGKPMNMQFEGSSTTGYDNVKKKYFVTWIDSMSTGLFTADGTYDAGTKTFTYSGETPDCMTDLKPVKVRILIKIVDKDKHVFEWHSPVNGKEMKTMEITYTRKK